MQGRYQMGAVKRNGSWGRVDEKRPTTLVFGELPQDVPRHFAGEDVAVLVDHDPFREDRFDA